jgi:Sulfotransferase domain
MIDTKKLPGAMQHWGQQAAIGAGWLTGGRRMRPGLLICGAQRCGTTSMYRTLSQHPAVLKPVLHKGVHYFDVGYDRGPRWYAAHFPLRISAARAERRTGLPTLTFESSPYYLFHPLAAERIARDLPGVRILVLLRDPVERAYSAHAHELARGFETEPFEAALELEDSRVEGEAEKLVADPGYHSFSHRHHAYVRRGRYVEQLERLERLVGRDRLHVVDSEEFFTRPEPVWAGVLDFLGLQCPELPRFDRHNTRPRAPMSESVRRRLAESFLSHDERLAAWWGRDLSWRR